MDDPDSPRSRALRLLRLGEDEAATRRDPFPGGVILRHPQCPLVWDANHIRLDVPWGGTARSLHAEVERASAAVGLAQPMLAISHEAEVERLAPGLVALGYTRAERVVMAQLRPPDRDPEVHAEDVPVGAVAGLRTAILEEAQPVHDEAIRQVLAWELHLAEVLGTRWLAAFADGQPVACARVLSRDGVGQVDDVATLPEMRGRGLASSVVLDGVARLRAEGAGLVVIVAEADDGPRELYAKLGFDPVACISRFHRRSG